MVFLSGWEAVGHLLLTALVQVDEVTITEKKLSKSSLVSWTDFVGNWFLSADDYSPYIDQNPDYKTKAILKTNIK